MGQKEEIERLIGEAYAHLRLRDWLSFDKTISELSLYSWGMIEDVIHEKMMRVGTLPALNLAYIYDAVTAFPYGSPPVTASTSHSPRYPELTWEWVGGFYDGEGYFDATIKEAYDTRMRRWYRTLSTTVGLGQKDRAILEKLRNFIDEELKTLGRIEYNPVTQYNTLAHRRHEDCLRLTKHIHPYLHLSPKRSQASNFITTTEAYAREKLEAEITRRRPALAKRYQRLLAIARDE